MIGYPASTSAPAVFSYSILLFQKSKISLNNKISGFYSSRGLRLAWYNKDVSLVVDYKHTYLIECTNTVDKVVRVYICLLCSDEKKFVQFTVHSVILLPPLPRTRCRLPTPILLPALDVPLTGSNAPTEKGSYRYRYILYRIKNLGFHSPRGLA